MRVGGAKEHCRITRSSIRIGDSRQPVEAVRERVARSAFSQHHSERFAERLLCLYQIALQEQRAAEVTQAARNVVSVHYVVRAQACLDDALSEILRGLVVPAGERATTPRLRSAWAAYVTVTEVRSQCSKTCRLSFN